MARFVRRLMDELMQSERLASAGYGGNGMVIDGGRGANYSTDDIEKKVRPSFLAKYAAQAVKDIKKYYEETTGYVPSFTQVRNLTLKAIEPIRNRFTREVRGVVHGDYRLDNRDISLNAYSLDAPEVADSSTKKELRGLGLTKPLYDALVHELTHAAQHQLGIIGNYTKRFKALSRLAIEGATTHQTYEITGKPQPEYRKEQKFFKKIMNLTRSKKNAVLGWVPHLRQSPMYTSVAA
ncbi:MAG: hypothetical protein ABIA21_02685 [Candidatus Aenigmatarchaeota archaeon]